jgi:hypothetical protein
MCEWMLVIQEVGQSQGLCFGKLDEHFVCHESVQTLKKELLACVTCNLTNEMVVTLFGFNHKPKCKNLILDNTKSYNYAIRYSDIQLSKR